MKPLTGPFAARQRARFLLDSVGTLQDAYRRYGPLSAVGSSVPGRRGSLDVLALGPEYNRLVLGDAVLFRNSTPNPPGAALGRIRCGLISMNGAKHRQQRKLIMPPFTRQSVEGYSSAMAAVVAQTVDGWKAGQVVEMRAEMRALALGVSARILFRREDPAKIDKLGGMVQEYLRRSASVGVHLFPFNVPGTPYRGLRRHAEHIERTLQDVVRNRRAQPHGEPDLLDLLIEKRDQNDGSMTEVDLLGQAFILLAASYENVATALTWTLFLIAQHPTIAHELCDEIGDGFTTGDRLATLPFLDAVLRESLRILPPVPFTVRVAGEATELGGLSLQAGDRVLCSQYVTHHMPHLFPDPERFQPSRWFEIDPRPEEYLPFGIGPRACAGGTMAVAEMKLALAIILQRWRVVVQPGTRIDRHVRVSMTPKADLLMTVEPRSQPFRAVRVVGNIHDMVNLDGGTPHGRSRVSPWGRHRANGQRVTS